MRVALRLACALLLAVGCRAPELTEPGESVALCCKATGEDEISFVGCRQQPRVCRAAESVWVRGPIACVGAEDPSCSDGLCCEIVVAELEVEPEPEPEPTPESASKPEPTEPVRLPRPLDVPKLMCNASVEQGLEGAVVLEVSVDAEGKVVGVEIREGFEPSCDALARDALLAASFEPAKDAQGRPVAASLEYEYRFMLAE